MDESNGNSEEVNTAKTEKQKTDSSDMKKQQKSRLDMVFMHVTTLVHVLILGYAIFMIVLCFKDEFTFFTWHPLLMTIGWLLLMTEGILFLSKDNILSSKLTLRGRSRVHWGLQVCACALVFAAFGVVVQNKEDFGWKHFTSWHGICGLISVCLCIPTMLLGNLTMFSSNFKTYVRPTVSKFFHSTFGTLTFAMGMATLILSLKTEFFKGKTSNSDLAYGLGMFIYVLSGIWTLLKPLLNNVNRFKSF